MHKFVRENIGCKHVFFVVVELGCFLGIIPVRFSLDIQKAWRFTSWLNQFGICQLDELVILQVICLG